MVIFHGTTFLMKENSLFEFNVMKLIVLIIAYEHAFAK